MSDLSGLPEAKHGLEILGPFSDKYHVVVIDGHVVPDLKCSENPDGTWDLACDFCVRIVPNKDELLAWLPWIAAAMAHAAGYYATFPPGEKRGYAQRIFGITGVRADGVRPTLSLVTSEEPA